MIYKNMTELAVPSVDCVVKVGDTIADIKEGVNAKVWTVGVVPGSNELGLTLDEVNLCLLPNWSSANRMSATVCWLPEPIIQ